MTESRPEPDSVVNPQLYRWHMAKIIESQFKRAARPVCEIAIRRTAKDALTTGHNGKEGG